VTYSFHPEAEIELMEAFAFYRTEGGDAIARVFLKEVGRVAELLVANPEFGTPVGGARRSYHLRRFPYSLIYRAAADGIRILVVSHQHRRPGYWRGRK
jgi:plasmid stabilization system protein ParE